YHTATRSPRKDTLFGRVLLACALAETDKLGFFSARNVRPPLSKIMGKPIDIPAFARHLNEFAEEKRGRILEKVGDQRRFLFRFRNPLMQPFVVLQGMASGVLDPEELPDGWR
ncbi:MAG: ATP-binding protein, partial [Actinobacteria bacterium]|nr:ATP-binding protein [Actinomycetota bacterium]